MKIEIWSDFMCPFCYIGKRRFELALGSFEHKGDVEIVWKSFQLNPALKTDLGITIHQYLANIKGFTLENATKMNGQVTAMAKEVGLDYRFDKAKVANTFDAHRLLHLAKKYGLQDIAEEQLLAAYFTNGDNIADYAVLSRIGINIGINESEITQMFEGALYSDEVNMDVNEAGKLGARGVPFFVFNRKFAVSGAQPSETFLEVLKKSHTEWAQENNKSIFEVTSGEVCSTDGQCN
jgi:predicted DsbA family dithiol-disulfide isomerase